MNHKDQWLRGIRRTKVRAKLVRLFLYVAFALPILGSIYILSSSRTESTFLYGDYSRFGSNTFGTQQSLEVFNLLLNILIVTTLVFLVRKYSSIPRSATALLNLPASSEFTSLHETIFGLADAMGIPSGTLETQIDTRDFGVSPRVVRFRGGQSLGELLIAPSTALVVPVGFLKLFAEEPETAKAILAHEFAHVRQEDWQLWSFSSAYAEGMKTFVLPLALFLSVVTVLDMAQLFVTQQQIETEAYNLRDYAALLDYQAAKNAEVRALFESSVFASRLDDPRMKLRKTREELVLRYMDTARVFAFPLVQLVILALILRMRSTSEGLADQAAIVYVGAPAILRALSRCGSKRPWWLFLSAHPRLAKRVAAISRFANVDKMHALATATPEPMGFLLPKSLRGGLPITSQLGVDRSPIPRWHLVGFCAAWAAGAAIAGPLWSLRAGFSITIDTFAPVLVETAFVVALTVALSLHRRLLVAIFAAALAQIAVSVAVYPWSRSGLVPFLHLVFIGVIPHSVLFVFLYAITSRRYQIGKALIISGSCALAVSLAITLIQNAGTNPASSIRIVQWNLCSVAARVLCLYLWFRVFQPEIDGAGIRSKSDVESVSVS